MHLELQMFTQSAEPCFLRRIQILLEYHFKIGKEQLFSKGFIIEEVIFETLILGSNGIDTAF